MKIKRFDPKKVSENVELHDEFWCPPTEDWITVAECYQDYLDANCFGDKNNPCYKCNLGQKVREVYSVYTPGKSEVEPKEKPEPPNLL